jgi:hypothetical protein
MIEDFKYFSKGKVFPAAMIRNKKKKMRKKRR